MTFSSRRVRATVAGLALLGVAIAPALNQLPAQAAAPSAATRSPEPSAGGLIGDPVTGLSEIDQAGAAVAPTSAQKTAAESLGSGVSVTWNEAGTPASIVAKDGVLAPATSGATPAAAALAWITAHRDLLGLTQSQVDGLELVSDQPFADSAARAVLYRQKFGGLVPATRGMVTVGVAADHTIAYVSSSLVKGAGPVPAATLSPQAGWLLAAANVERTVSVPNIAKITSSVSDGWTRLQVPGLADSQLARLRAFVKNDGTIRPVIEADVIDSSAGSLLGYRVLVDAASGEVLLRHNAVENSNNAFSFQGSYTPVACGQVHPFSLTDGNTKTIAVLAAAAVAADDITIKLTGPGGASLGNFDLLTSPETATYTAPGGGTLAQGDYGVQVCAFDGAQIGGPYTVAVTTLDTGATVEGLPKPAWRAFAANPSLDTLSSTTGGPTNSVIECWYAGTAGCSPGEAHQNIASFGPWDQLNGVPSLTTIGNNANTHEAWASPLTPGGTEQAPYSATRDYTGEFTDAWNNNQCATTNLVPGGNDINAVVTNLFVGHNRIHDFAYYLGFNEQNYNLQTDNAGRGGQGGDAEVGNVQAGAINGGYPSFEGRDNANQIALQDGVPGITNQYLFQPIAGAFYSPCADGAMDTGIYGHEYTHAISNRMVGGPDDGLTSEQGGAMGESWSDLDAAEYQFENDYPTGTNPWSLGSYTTGNFAKGIRDFAINDNPLNFGDYGFDTTGAEVHADGEIWNGTLWEVRQALVDKWDAAGFTYTNKALQKQCAEATATATPLAASACPGNRRWLQLIYDAWLLQPGATDMLQARDAMLAADQMRFGGANQDVIASAFARRGMGVGASTVLDGATPDPDSTDVTPSFRSAYGNNSTVTFTSASPGKVYVGNFEARTTPIADTVAATALPAAAPFTPGIYRITFVSPTNGFRRFILTVPDNGVAFTQPVGDQAVNVAGSASGATVIGATTGSLNAAALIDGTEETNWAGVTTEDVDVSNPGVMVDLAGTGVQTISAAKVSALLHPAPAAGPEVPLLVGGAQAEDDPDSGSRFTALRKFALQACVTGCTDPANYQTFFTSANDAFPAEIPRPVAPDQTMRTFRFAPVQAAAVRLVALENQCTGQAKYAGELDADPANPTDCKTGSDRGTIVHAAELQVFADAIPDDPTDGVPGTGVPGSGTPGQGTSALPSKVKTHTRIRLPRIEQVMGKESTPMKFQVVAKTTSNGAKAGVAVIKLDGKKVKTVKIAVTLKHGRKVVGNTFRIPKGLGLGRHTLIVKFKSSNPSVFTNSRSRKIVITVVRSR